MQKKGNKHMRHVCFPREMRWVAARVISPSRVIRELTRVTRKVEQVSGQLGDTATHPMGCSTHRVPRGSQSSGDGGEGRQDEL